MKELFDKVSNKCSKLTTRLYSTSFSIGISILDKTYRMPIYAIYGFVRFADEIVDTFHDYDKKELLNEFWEDTYKAIDRKISLNPVLNSFQKVVHEYSINKELIDTFLKSMEMDLYETPEYDQETYEKYILGSAEVVGLMCLKVFTEGNEQEYERLKPYAMSLGSAFQKINFLRDMHHDYNLLGRRYFPGVSFNHFTDSEKKEILIDIKKDFTKGLQGIKMLNKGARFGVYVAYAYYYKLLLKIANTPTNQLLESRIRIPNREKYYLLASSYFKHQMNLI